MTDHPPDDAGPDDATAVAGELALRVLSPADEARARAREASDPAFAAEVQIWNDRLAALAEEIPAVQPSTDVWPGVEARIGAAAAPAANDNGRAGFWRAWALGSTGLLAASLVAVAVLATRPAPVPVVQPAPVGGVTRIATLSLESGTPAVTLVYDTVTGNLFLAPTAPMDPDAGVPHLWLVRPDGAGVQLVGAIDGSASSRHTLDSVLAATADQARAVAISMEAPGHTPAADRPDGPVVASGELQAL
ncbi:MAG: anti-sigma factor [Brevundimonas sp.]|uniref:anti-sigma factor n=1 Tax=Brevundimonas sp. TaxID=1871086 RepID=UPI0027353631|nr:anti-sigma factor [Brevundimonas sp.]MDP3405627.1 anti-sigma factor [Brevundimonas sp.]